MFGLPKLNIRDQFKGFFDASVTGALNSIFPQYSTFAAYFKNTVFKKNLHKERPQTAKNTIDIDGYNLATNQITNTISGTYNPIKKFWYLLQSFFGYRYSERVQDSLKVLTEGANKYDSYQFANRSLTLLVSQMKNRIATIQGTLSWLGLKLNKKVMKDSAVQGFKNAINSWLQPFQELIHGGVKGFGFTKKDWDFLKDLRDSLAYGAYSPYVKDVVAQIDGVLKEAQSAWKAQFDAQERAKYQAQRRSAQASSQMKSTQQAA
jgi:hypothetical protein